jgi:hypothetical protein
MSPAIGPAPVSADAAADGGGGSSTGDAPGAAGGGGSTMQQQAWAAAGSLATNAASAASVAAESARAGINRLYASFQGSSRGGCSRQGRGTDTVKTRWKKGRVRALAGGHTVTVQAREALSCVHTTRKGIINRIVD